MIAEGVLAIEYGASAEDVARTCHAHVCFSFGLSSFVFTPIFFCLAHVIGSIQGGCYGSLWETHSHVIPYFSNYLV